MTEQKGPYKYGHYFVESVSTKKGSDTVTIVSPRFTERHEYRIPGLFPGKNYKRLCDLPDEKLEAFAMWTSAKLSLNETQVLEELVFLRNREIKKK